MSELPTEVPLPAGFAPADPSGSPTPPATPKDAATVMLMRDTPAGPEVFVLRRVAGMAFAGGMTVFPGGGVDERDADSAVNWCGPGPEWWAERFGCEVALARALVCAAVRETFEESGVLLAGPDPEGVVSDARPYHAARAALVARELSFARFLADNGLVLRADLLRPWANWLTPAEEPRRYDTRFFLAALPAGQRADGDTSEADDAGWERPADVLESWRQGRRAMLPPTWKTLAELAEHATTADAMAAERVIGKIIPKLVREGAEVRVLLPEHPDYEPGA